MGAAVAVGFGYVFYAVSAMAFILGLLVLPFAIETRGKALPT